MSLIADTDSRAISAIEGQQVIVDAQQMTKALVRHFAENRNPRKVGPDVIVQVRCYSCTHIRQFHDSPDAIAIEPINNRADCHNQQGHKPPLLPEGRRIVNRIVAG
jgi:hypothetical protein